MSLTHELDTDTAAYRDDTLAHELAQGASPHARHTYPEDFAAGLYMVRSIHNGAAEFRKLVVAP